MRYLSRKLLRTAALMLSSSVLLTACSSAPTAPARRPELLAREPLGPSFQDQMDCFLAGTPPELIESGAPCKPATPPKTP